MRVTNILFPTPAISNPISGLSFPDIRDRGGEPNLNGVNTLFQGLPNIEFASPEHIIGPGNLMRINLYSSERIQSLASKNYIFLL